MCIYTNFFRSSLYGADSKLLSGAASSHFRPYLSSVQSTQFVQNFIQTIVHLAEHRYLQTQ